MSKSRWLRIYEKLPVPIQNVACTLAGFKMRRQRYGPVFQRALVFLEESQWWPLGQQLEYQNEQLRKLIRFAYDRVPYYHEVLKALRLRPDDIKTVADLPMLPILDKQTVRERHADLVARDWPAARLVHSHTGGTTGTALQLVADIDTQCWGWAFVWRHRRRFGLQLHDNHITFAGRSVVPMDTLKPPFWRRNLPMHQTYVSVHHLTTQNMPVLANYLARRNVPFYIGYPSALYLLATYLLETNTKLPHPPRVVVTASETVLPHHRQSLREAFGATVADYYGQSEYCGCISECEKGGYHVDMESGVVEFEPVERCPEMYQMICTGFLNWAMPFIRYRVGDAAVRQSGNCPCSRQSHLVSRIDGRIESYVSTPDGRRLGRLDFLFKDSSLIREAQFVQEALDHVTIRLVPEPGYDHRYEQEFVKEVRTYLGDAIRIDVEKVRELPRETNGKFRQIISSVQAAGQKQGQPMSGGASVFPGQR